MENHLISTNKTLLDALNQINNLKCGPLVLFVVDESGRVVLDKNVTYDRYGIRPVMRLFNKLIFD